MKSILIVMAVLSLLPTLSIADEIEKIHTILNADKRFDKLKQAAAGDVNAFEDILHYEYLHTCLKIDCPVYSEPEYPEFVTGLAKVKLKSIQDANLKYAKALVELNKKIQNDCKSEEMNELLTQEQTPKCSQEIKCEGSGATLLADYFWESKKFEKAIEKSHRNLSPEEKVIAGVDISSALKKPFWQPQDEGYDNYPIDYAYPQFSLGTPMTTNIVNTKKGFFSKKTEKIYEAILYGSEIPEGIMTIRGLKCVGNQVIKNDKLKVYDRSCKVYVGNDNLQLDVLNSGLMISEGKMGIAKDTYEKNEAKNNCLKNPTAVLQKTVSNKNASSSKVNDSQRGEIKEVTPVSKKSEESNKASKQ